MTSWAERERARERSIARRIERERARIGSLPEDERAALERKAARVAARLMEARNMEAVADRARRPYAVAAAEVARKDREDDARLSPIRGKVSSEGGAGLPGSEV